VGGWWLALGDDRFEQDGPAHEGVAAIADTGLHRQVQVVGFMSEAADFGRCLCNVEDEHTASARDIVVIGHDASSSCPWGRRGDVARGPATWGRASTSVGTEASALEALLLT